MNRLKLLLKEIFALDVRSLALLRIGTALLLLLNLILCYSNLQFFYTDNGFLPREAAFLKNPWSISLYYATGTWEGVIVLFIISAICSFFLLVGYKTRLFTILSWILLISLQDRNSYVLQSGDLLLRMILFWGIFLPWGNYFAIDTLHKKKPRQKTIASFATASFMLQIAFLYFFAFGHKLATDLWLPKGTAIWYVLHRTQTATTLGTSLSHFPFPIWQLSSYGVLILEGLAGFLLLVPLYHQKIRTAAIGTLILVHILFGLILQIGLFPFIDIVTLCGLLPPFFWDKTHPLQRYITQHLWYKNTKRWIDSTIKPLVSPKQTFIHFLSPSKEILIINVAVSFFVLYIFWINLTGYRKFPYKMPLQLLSIASLLHINQQWNMFENPPGYDEIYVAVGTTKTGKRFYLFPYEKPFARKTLNHDTFHYPDYRFRKYFESMEWSHSEKLYYAAYLCKTWEEKYKDKILIGSMRRAITIDGNKTESKMKVFGIYTCKNPTNYNKVKSLTIKENKIYN